MPISISDSTASAASIESRIKAEARALGLAAAGIARLDDD
jgi:hypothetical protein